MHRVDNVVVSSQKARSWAAIAAVYRVARPLSHDPMATHKHDQAADRCPVRLVIHLASFPHVSGLS